MAEHGFDADDETRRRLRALDPARSLEPVDAAALAQTLEDTMSQPTEPARNPRRLAMIGAAAAVAVAVAVGVAVSVGNDDGPAKSPPTATKATVTALSAGPAFAGKCMAPSAKNVAGQTIAFEGKVTGVAEGVVTLAASRFFRGDATDLVTIAEPDQGMSEMPVDFQVGQTYLVGATDGQVSICGLSGLATDDLRALYDQAFGG